MKLISRLAFGCTACVLLANFGCEPSRSPSSPTQKTETRTQTQLALNWYPEMEHGGYLAAKALGRYAEAGIDVEITPGGPGAPQLVISELAAGHIEFAVSDADNVVKGRANGVPLVALLAPLQKSPRCIMVHKASGFQKLEDLKDVELAISESRPFALWMKKKLPLTNVTFVPFSGQVGEFLTKPNFAQQAFVFSEPFVAKEKGSDPEVLMVSDIGFNPYASLLVTTETVIKEKPELVKAVVKASLEGWEQYLRSPAETNEYIRTLNSDISAEALAFGAESMAPLCQPSEGQQVGAMTLERWTELVQQIEELNDIPAGSVKAAECFTAEYLGKSPVVPAGKM